MEVIAGPVNKYRLVRQKLSLICSLHTFCRNPQISRCLQIIYAFLCILCISAAARRVALLPRHDEFIMAVTAPSHISDLSKGDEKRWEEKV